MRTWILPLGIGVALPVALGLVSFGCSGPEDDGPAEQNCVDGNDEDGDGLTDCDDPDCAATLACSDTVDTDEDTDEDTDDTGTTGIPDLGDGSAAAIYGENDGDWAGFAIGGGADVNGDGNADIIVGAPRFDCEDANGNEMADSGAAFVFFGPVSGAQDVTDADITVCGGRPEAQLGSWVGLANGLTGESSADVVVSAPRDRSGRVFVLSDLAAATDPYIADPTAEGTPVTVDIVGEGVEYHFGDIFTITPLGNGSGTPDLLIGSDAWSDTEAGSQGANLGRTYVFQGPLPTDDQVRGSRADTWFSGAQAGEDSGRSVGVADFNGDGRQDVAIGALGTNWDGAPNGGAVYVKWGDFAGSRYGVDDADVTLQASARDEGVGQAITALDYNDDGVDDLVVGAHTVSQERGAAYVWFGKNGGWESDGKTTDVDVALRGAAAFDRAGHGVDAVGDITGDGVDDLVVGALGVSAQGASQRGAVYVIAGNLVTGAVDVDRSAWATYLGNVGEEWAGHRIAGPGDVTGDGQADLLIGAYRQNLGGDLAGAAYLLEGPIAQQER